MVWWDPVMLTFAGSIEEDGEISLRTDMLDEIYDPITLGYRLGYRIPDEVLDKLLEDFDSSTWPDEVHYFILRMIRS